MTAPAAPVTIPGHGGSPSLAVRDYWWYRVRSELLRTVFEPRIGAPQWVLDVGSADGPSVDWLSQHGRKVSLDVDPRGLSAGGICGSVLTLPFADAKFDVVAAFDVVEHCEPESTALSELARVLRPGGTLVVSVPAYQWAWSDHDVANGHHRRYTRGRAVRAIQAAGLEVTRTTYAFAGVFPLFAAERIARRARNRLRPPKDRATGAVDIVTVPEVSPGMDKVLSGLSRLDLALLRRFDLPFGSSVFLSAVKPETA